MAESVSLAQDLIRIHKVISRSLEVGLGKGKGYQQSGLSQAQELRGYSSYIQCLVAVLSSHHTSEDLIAFPALRKVIADAPYGQLAADHHWVEIILTGVPQALTDLAGNTPTIGLNAIVSTLARLSQIWYPHIALEEKCFSEEALNSTLSIKEQNNISLATSKHSQEYANPPYLVIPFLLFNLEQEERLKMAATLPPTIVDELVPKVWKDQWAPMKPFLLD
jgi:hemerythrin-like domain-containing protein